MKHLWKEYKCRCSVNSTAMHLNVIDEVKHGRSSEKNCHYLLMKNLLLNGQLMSFCLPCISAFMFLIIFFSRYLVG